MIEEKALIDSNVLVYTYSEDSIKKAAAVKLLSECFKGDKKFCIALQNIGEFCSVSIKRYKADPYDTNTIAQSLLASEHFLKVHYKESTFFAAISMVSDFRLQFWDAMLASTMLENGVSTIYTENTKDFKIPGIKAINPFLKQ